MLKRAQRVPSGLFSRVAQNNKTGHSENFSVRFVRSDIPRAAVIVSKKVARSAVLRNTLKRKMRATLAPLLSNIQMTVLVYAKKGASSLSVADAEKELAALFQSLN